jgi:hypothetical protein
MFSCPICNETIFISKLCKDCEKIRQLSKLYGKDVLLSILEKTMVIQQIKKKDDDSKYHESSPQ